MIIRFASISIRIIIPNSELYTYINEYLFKHKNNVKRSILCTK